MPKFSQDKTSRIKRARSAALIRYSKQTNPSHRQQSGEGHLHTKDPNPEVHSMTEGSASQGSFDNPSNVMVDSLFWQYTQNLPRTKPELFRLQVLRQFTYFRRTLKFSRSQSLLHVSRINQIGKSTIERWYRNFLSTGNVMEFPSDCRPGPSPMFDSDQLALLNNFLLENSIVIKSGHSHAGCSLTIPKIIDWVNENFSIYPSPGLIFKVLKMLNFRWLDSSVPDVRSSYNKIGHDRQDVVQYRQTYFLPKFIQFFQSSRFIVVCQDESMFNCNMHSPFFYVKCDQFGNKWASEMQKKASPEKNTPGKNIFSHGRWLYDSFWVYQRDSSNH